MVSRREGDLKGKGDEVPCPKEMGDPRSTYLGKYFCLGTAYLVWEKGESMSHFIFLRLRVIDQQEILKNISAKIAIVVAFGAGMKNQ